MGATVLTGVVSKAGAMAKTVTMTVSRVKTHPKLLKTYVRHKKYLVHDPEESLTVGERIRAQACRPLSARKRFVLLERLGFQSQQDEAPVDEEAQALRRLRAEAAMPAEQRLRIEIERRVKEEVRAHRR